MTALDQALVQAPDAATASAVADRLEELRTGRLSPTVRLLLRRAKRELEQSRLRDAGNDLDDAVALQPDQALLWRERAAVRALAGDPDGAITDLGGALNRDPTDIQSWSALSTVSEQQGRSQQALEAWERVLRLDPMISGGVARLLRLHAKMVGAPT